MNDKEQIALKRMKIAIAKYREGAAPKYSPWKVNYDAMVDLLGVLISGVDDLTIPAQSEASEGRDVEIVALKAEIADLERRLMSLLPASPITEADMEWGRKAATALQSTKGESDEQG